MSTLRRFFKDTIIYGVAAVLPRAVNILLVKLHTSTLQSSKYAENTLYFVYAAYINALLTYGMETAFFRFFTKEKAKGKVISTSFISLLITTMLFFITAFYFSTNIARFFGFEDPLYFQILIIVTTFDTLVVLPYSYLRVMNRPFRFTFYKLFNIFVYALFNLFFLLYVPFAVKNGYFVPEYIVNYYHSHPLVLFIFIANLIASLATFILMMPIILKFDIRFDPKLLKRMLLYGLPLMIGNIAFITNENLDKILIGNLLGKEQMGIYAACYKLGVFMTLYIMAFRLGAEPFFFNQSSKKNAPEIYARVLTWFSIIGAFFMLFIVVFIDFFAKLLLGKPEYFEALKIVPVILLANLFLGISFNLSIWYKLVDKTRYGMYFSIGASVITILMNLWLIPVIGYMASAWATLAAYGFSMTISYIFGRKHYAIPYKVLKIFSFIGLATLLSWASFTYFRGNYLISAGFLAAYLIYILLKEKQELQNIFTK